jgi:hypothetical protein
MAFTPVIRVILIPGNVALRHQPECEKKHSETPLFTWYNLTTSLKEKPIAAFPWLL